MSDGDTQSAHIPLARRSHRAHRPARGPGRGALSGSGETWVLVNTRHIDHKCFAQDPMADNGTLSFLKSFLISDVTLV